MNGGQQLETQHQQGTEAHPQPDSKTAATTSDENSTGAGVGLTTGGTGAAPTVKMQQSRQDAPAVTPATVTAEAAPAMTTASAAASAVAAAAAATATASPIASGANGSGGNNNGVGNSSPTTAAQTVAAINKKRKKEGLKPIITTDNPAPGYVYAFLGSLLHFCRLCCCIVTLCFCVLSLRVLFPAQANPVLVASDAGPWIWSVCRRPSSVVFCYAVFRSMGDVSRAQVAFWFMIAGQSAGRPCSQSNQSIGQPARKTSSSNWTSGWRIGGDGEENWLRRKRAKLGRARTWPGEHCGRKRSFAGTEDSLIPNKHHMSQGIWL